MQPDSRKLLLDMATAVGKIDAYMEGVTLDQFEATSSLRDAVQWNFAVIGEALAQLIKIDPQTADLISESRRIVAFRNQLIHGYGVIRNDITYAIVSDKLPILRREVGLLLQSE